MSAPERPASALAYLREAVAAFKDRARSVCIPAQDAAVKLVCDKMTPAEVADSAARRSITTDGAEAVVVLGPLRAIERVLEADQWTGPKTWDQRAADTLADEVATLVRRGVISSRSPAADALLDYRDPPSTPRADRMAWLEAENERLTSEAADPRRAVIREVLDTLKREGLKKGAAKLAAELGATGGGDADQP